MRSDRKIEKLLGGTAVPSVVAGAHRTQLKAELLRQVQGRKEKETKMNRRRLFIPTRAIKIAAAVLLVVALVATGWAAERIYSEFVKKTHVTEEIPGGSFTAPDGRVVGLIQVIGTTIDPDSGETEEDVRARWREMKSLIAEGKYEFVKTIESYTGESYYRYKFVLSDGEQCVRTFWTRLEEVDSWEDYVQKSEAQSQRKLDAIAEAVAAGRFRLLDVAALRSHICREVDTGQEINVLCILQTNREPLAFVRPHPIRMGDPTYEMSWADHLTAIAEGSRELIDMEITSSYTYEITFPDGSTTTWGYGSGLGSVGKPLAKPED